MIERARPGLRLVPKERVFEAEPPKRAPGSEPVPFAIPLRMPTAHALWRRTHAERESPLRKWIRKMVRR